MELEIFCQLFLSVFLAGLIGLEREIKKKWAGLQTYSLVSLGSCLFAIMTSTLTELFRGEFGIALDPSRVVLAIATGIGFLGAGVIFRQQTHIEGLTTAAGLWVTAAIGLACGLKLYFLAVFSTFLTILIFAGFGLLEEKFFKEGK